MTVTSSVANVAVKRPFSIPAPALADDTPSRHPCKIRIPSAQKSRFMFDPYKAQVTLGLEDGELYSGSEESDDVDDAAFDDIVNDSSSTALTSHVYGSVSSPLPVDARGTITASSQKFNGPNAGSCVVSGSSSTQPSGQPSIFFSSDSTLPALCSQLHVDESSAAAFAAGAHFTSGDGCFRMKAGNVHHVLVRFKFSEDVYVVPHCDRRGLSVEDLVVVEGDRGENIGQVVEDLSAKYDENDMSGKPILIRRALNKDRKKYYHARRKDAVASKVAQQLVQDLGLQMHVLDAEFQTDLAKLTIYYRSPLPQGSSSDAAIDFRELQRQLFKQFRCRIWLLNWDQDPHLQSLVQAQLHAGHGGASTDVNKAAAQALITPVLGTAQLPMQHFGPQFQTVQPSCFPTASCVSAVSLQPAIFGAIHTSNVARGWNVSGLQLSAQQFSFSASQQHRPAASYAPAVQRAPHVAF